MAPPRKITNGRSPLVNKQHQITAFFSKSPISINFSKSLNPNPNSSPPATPSPVNGKEKPKSTAKVTAKPVLVIGAQKAGNVSPPSAEYKEEVVGRRVRVYWPMDEEWYEGRVKSYDAAGARHVVEYDDQEEELLDLSKEKFEWIGSNVSGNDENVRKFRRLRKVAVVVEDEEEEEEEAGVNLGVEDDDSSDEDWGKNVDEEEAKAKEEEAEADAEVKNFVEEMEAVDEGEVEDMERLKRKRGDNVEGGAGKRLKEGGGEDGDLSGSKKKKKGGFVVGEFGSKPVGIVIGN